MLLLGVLLKMSSHEKITPYLVNYTRISLLASY